MDKWLLQEIKNYLDITWEDSATDQKVEGMIQAGVCYLERKAGEALDFKTQPDALALLKDYVRYARDGAADVFENNYRSLILDMQHDRMMRRRAEGKTNAEGSISAGQ